MAKKEKENKVKKDKKQNNKPTTKQPKEKFFAGIKRELKLVKWPTFKEIVKYTIATVVFCLILVAFFELLNALMAFIKGLFN